MPCKLSDLRRVVEEFAVRVECREADARAIGADDVETESICAFGETGALETATRLAVEVEERGSMGRAAGGEADGVAAGVGEGFVVLLLELGGIGLRCR